MLKDDSPQAVSQRKIWQLVEGHGRHALKLTLEALMEWERDLFLGCAHHERAPERRGYRNGYQERRLDCRLGQLALRKPRVRGCDQPFQTHIIDRYQRRQRDLDLCVLGWVAGGLSTRRVSVAFQGAFEGLLSAGTVSRIVAGVDGQVRAFHERPLRHGYRFVFLDAKHAYTSRRRRGRGRGKKQKAALLLAWGVRHQGQEELIDFRSVPCEEERNWTEFLSDLERRGLREENPWSQRLEMIVSDGDQGLLAALYMVYPSVPKQRCIFHKIQDITDHLIDKDHREAILQGASGIYRGLTTPDQARQRLVQWVERWGEAQPQAVRCFIYDFEQTLTYLNAPPQWRGRLRTTNPVERFIRELNRKSKQVGVYPSAQSWERHTYLVWKNLQTTGYAPTVRQAQQTLFTQNS